LTSNNHYYKQIFKCNYKNVKTDSKKTGRGSENQ